MTPEAFDAWFPRLIRALAALGGIAIMGFETAIDHSDRPWIYAAAIAMMGLPAAQAGERLLGKLQGGTPASTDPPDLHTQGFAPPPAPPPAPSPPPTRKSRSKAKHSPPPPGSTDAPTVGDTGEPL